MVSSGGEMISRFGDSHCESVSIVICDPVRVSPNMSGNLQSLMVMVSATLETSKQGTKWSKERKGERKEEREGGREEERRKSCFGQ